MDPNALCNLGIKYGCGRNGLSVDQAKCVELLRESASLGFPPAQYQLGVFHHSGDMGLEQNEEKSLKYHEEAAAGGHIIARHNLGCTAYENSDHVAAMRYWGLSASGGYKWSMDSLIDCFEHGFLYHGDLAKTLQAFYRSKAEMKSDGRDQHIKNLKETGRYDGEDYDVY